MQVTFLREGYANNSSSCHSLISTKQELKDRLSGKYFYDDCLCASTEAKKSYLLACLYATYNKYVCCHNPFATYGTTEKVTKMMFREFIKKNLSSIFPKKLLENIKMIDHQSEIIFPIKRDTDYPELHLEFIKDFISYVLKTNFAIVGGNDNYEKETEEVKDEDEELSVKLLWEFLKESRAHETLCAYDEKTHEYVLSKKSGPICKICFGEKVGTKSQFPYLVDIKITDFCDRGCNYCYMDSSRKGKDADFYYVASLASTLRKANVFEVALGGGEPTSYGKNSAWEGFANLCKNFKNMGFKVAITTKNDRLHKTGQFDSLCEAIDSIAFSCNSAYELKNVLELEEAFEKEKQREIKENGYNQHGKFCSGGQFSIQYILELGKTKDLQEFLIAARAMGFRSITILGAKECGRGKKQKWHKHNGSWIDVVKQECERGMRIGVDSVLVKKYRDQLLQADIPHFCLEGVEGKSTCFIDAVNQKLHVSSFDKESESYDMKMSREWKMEEKNLQTFLEAFSKV